MSIVDNQRPLNFDKSPESDGEIRKRREIEEFIKEYTEQNLPLDVLVKLSLTPYGLVNDHLRKILWPQLAGVDVNDLEQAPSLEELQYHPEYNQLPEDLPFEELLKTSSKLFQKYSLTEIEKDVEDLIFQEKKQRQAEEKMIMKRRRNNSRPATANRLHSISQWLPNIFTSKSVILTTAVSIVVGVCAYYYKNQYLAAGIS
ncbi:uncharacterized protein [Drosophila takahashii]|uniref:uncharacterized protein isoform X2 n=1 Tax=Drosophila takahashii TaxID=29030 RepID=UPI0038992389